MITLSLPKPIEQYQGSLKTSLESIVAGDYVACYIWQQWNIVQVTRTTPTMVVVVDTRYWRGTGKKAGENMWSAKCASLSQPYQRMDGTTITYYEWVVEMVKDSFWIAARSTVRQRADKLISKQGGRSTEQVIAMVLVGDPEWEKFFQESFPDNWRDVVHSGEHRLQDSLSEINSVLIEEE